VGWQVALRLFVYRISFAIMTLLAAAGCGNSNSQSNDANGNVGGAGGSDRGSDRGAACSAPVHLQFTILQTINRSGNAFTEGFYFNQGTIFESTGAYSSPSIINQISPSTGQVQQVAITPNSDFGEGLTFFGGNLYQLTYTSQRVYEYDSNFKLLRTLSFPIAQGWGLASLQNEFVVTDGSDQVYFMPADFSKVDGAIVVHDNAGKTYDQLNQIQVVGTTMYSNVWFTNEILTVDLTSGCVTGIIDMTPLLAAFSTGELAAIHSDANFVLNGIAYSPTDNTFYVTGKEWPKIFKIALH
jgi:glutaminyl-peptide cyclotransferase